MNINRDNYEMYFLLYVDRELSAEERAAVDQFVAEHPDLKTELELLLATSLPVEAMNYPSKSELLKKETVIDGQLEKLLQHLDNELDPIAVQSLEVNIAADETLKREWNLLQQVKLDPNETIIFEDKESLYRHEEKKVVYMRFWKVAVAAAIIIGFALFMGITKFSKNSKNQEVAGTKEQPVNKKASESIAGTSNEELNDKSQNNKQQLSESVADKMPANDDHSNQDKNIVSNNTTSEESVKPIKDKRSIQPGKDQPVKEELANTSNVKKETNNLPKPYFENINNRTSNETANANVKDNVGSLQNKSGDVKTDEKVIAQAKVKEAPVIIVDRELTEIDNSYAKTAVMNEGNSDINNNHILFIKEDNISRTKISGIFRKVKRVLSRNANIKTGNGIKIAGFEFAAR